jgi:hypothetical protein
METAGDIEVKEAMLVGFENRLRSTLIVVGIVTGILAVAAGAFVNKNLNQAAANAGNNREETANLVTAPDPFRDAVNEAVKAAELGRAAKSKADWISAADRWQEAVSLMRRVPPSSPNHEVAQTKVVEYQKYLVYAQESAASPPPPAATPATAETAAPEKASRKKSTSEAANTEKASRKKSTSETANSRPENRKKTSAEKANSEPEKSQKSASEKADSEKKESAK